MKKADILPPDGTGGNVIFRHYLKTSPENQFYVNKFSHINIIVLIKKNTAAQCG